MSKQCNFYGLTGLPDIQVDKPGKVPLELRGDSYDEAIEYARIHTPVGHQGLIDGQSVVCK